MASMKGEYVFPVIAIVTTCTNLCLAGPYFRVKCSACGTTQTNAVQNAETRLDGSLFSCGSGAFFGTFRVLAQCDRCHHLATVNLLQAEEDAWIQARQTGAELPSEGELFQRLVSVRTEYSARTAAVTQGCARCGGPLKVVYFPFHELPNAGKPGDVKVPLSIQCPVCGSNALEAVSAGCHFD